MTDTIDDLATMGWTPADLLTELRHQSVRFLSELPAPPRALRLRAGTVSVDLEWDATPLAAPPDRTAPPEPATPAEPDRPAPAEPNAVHVTSPSVGVFYAAPEPDAAPFVQVGDEVTAGRQVAIVEVMKLFVPVTAEAPGRVTAILKNDGDPVEYGEPLLTLTGSGDV